MANPRPDKDTRVIRASEVGAFAYCARAWWLGAVEGVHPEDLRHLESGQRAHERHGRQVLLSAALSRLAYVLLALAGLTGIGWLVSWLVG